MQFVLDLTAPSTKSILALDFRGILKEDWKAAQDAGREALSQAIGRIAWKLKVEALVVPSAASSGDNNLVVFPGRRRPGSSWKIQGVRDLPKKC
jgi:RES domain-containing protein